jgi:hypothetical protein
MFVFFSVGFWILVVVVGWLFLLLLLLMFQSSLFLLKHIQLHHYTNTMVLDTYNLGL